MLGIPRSPRAVYATGFASASTDALSSAGVIAWSSQSECPHRQHFRWVRGVHPLGHQQVHDFIGIVDDSARTDWQRREAWATVLVTPGHVSRGDPDKAHRET